MGVTTGTVVGTSVVEVVVVVGGSVVGGIVVAVEALAAPLTGVMARTFSPRSLLIALKGLCPALPKAVSCSDQEGIVPGV